MIKFNEISWVDKAHYNDLLSENKQLKNQCKFLLNKLEALSKKENSNYKIINETNMVIDNKGNIISKFPLYTMDPYTGKVIDINKL